MFCMPKEPPIIYRWPEEAGEPTGIHWSGTNMAVVATTRGAVWVESAEKTFLPVALAEVAGGNSLHRATESFHWYLMPHPDDKARCLLLALTSAASGLPRVSQRGPRSRAALLLCGSTRRGCGSDSLLPIADPVQRLRARE